MTTTSELVERAKQSGFAADVFRAHVVEAVRVSRPSRSRSDTVRGGAIGTTSSKIGYVAAPEKYTTDGDNYRVGWTLRPPQNDAEREALDKSMLTAWVEKSLSGASLAPSDDRDLPAYDATQAIVHALRGEIAAII